MSLSVDIYNNNGDFLGSLPGEPVVLDEYELYPLRFQPVGDPETDLMLLVNHQPLARHGEQFLFGSNKSERGRRGSISIQAAYDKRQETLGEIIITGTAFSEAHYQYLVRDLKQLLISLAAADETTIKGGYDAELQFIPSFQRQLRALKGYLDELEDNLVLVEQAPHHTVEKEYFLQAEQKPARMDARTVRWQATHGTAVHGRTLTFSHVQCYDLYENRFIVYILDRLAHYLSDLPGNFSRAIEQKLREVEQRIVEWENYRDIGDKDGAEERRAFREKQLSSLGEIRLKLWDAQQTTAPAYKREVGDCLERIQRLRQLPFLSGIKPEATFVLTPTLVLLRDPAYNAVYEGYRRLQKAFKLSDIERLGTLLDRTPRERTSKLYEYWVFLQVYVALRQMGFQDAPGSEGIWGLLDKSTFRLKSGEHLALVGDPDVYKYGGDKKLKVNLYYERRFGMPYGNFYPDIYIEFSRNSQRILILDAKYRNYSTSDCSYDRDVTDTARHKYKELQRWSHDEQAWLEIPELDSTKNKIRASFIVHSHADDKRFCDYGSAGQANQYGGIPLVPEETNANMTPLKRLLRMFMRVHLKIFQVCWHDKHSRPVWAEFEKSTRQNKAAWEGKYHCAECGNSWWVNHCGHWCGGDGVKVPKITFSDPTDNFFALDETGRKIGENVLLKCSHCNRAYKHHW